MVKNKSNIFYSSKPHNDLRTVKYVCDNPHVGKQFWIEYRDLSKNVTYDTVPKTKPKPKSTSLANSLKDYFMGPKEEEEFSVIDLIFPNTSDKKEDTKAQEDNIEEGFVLYKTLLNDTKYASYQKRVGRIAGHYKMTEAGYTLINPYFDNKLPASDARLYWIKKCDKKGGSTATTHRKLIFNAKEYHTEKKRNAPKVREFKDEKPAKNGDTVALASDVCSVYLAVPTSDMDTNHDLQKEAIVIVHPDKEKKFDDDEKYQQVTTYNYILGHKRSEQKGWVKSELLKKEDYFSPYNWQKFGFNTFDGGDEYMYDIKDLREASDTESKFIKTFWAAINNTKDEILDVFELDAAYRTLETQLDIAKMVCKHKSEWSYAAQEIADEVTKFYDYLIEKEDSSTKSDLEKLRDEKLEGIKGQVEKLMFWKEAAGIAYTPPPPEKKEEKKKNKLDFGNTDADRQEFGTPATVTTPTTTTEAAATTTAPTETKKEEPKKPERTYPSKENVYHFHPIAFVNQMKLMFGDTPEYCIQEMKVRAFLRLIKYKEGKPGEEGYRQIVGGDSFSDFSKHPEPRIWIERIKDHSSAAGAYQIMKNTWNSTNLQKYKTKYGIKDFSQLSQDLFAVALLKHKRATSNTLPRRSKLDEWGSNWLVKMKNVHKETLKDYSNKSTLTVDDFPNYKNKYDNAYGDIIKMLIQNNLDRALLIAAPEWASFPESPYGQEASNYTLADAKIKYREFLLQEIKGETDLYLEAGFLKKFGYDCCNKNVDTSEASSDGKEPIDLRPFIPWQTQMSPDLFGWKSRQQVSCYRASIKLLEYAGIKNGGTLGSDITPKNLYGFFDKKNVIQTAVEQNNSIIVIKDGVKRAIDYLDQELEKGNPILVGVRHTYFKKDKTKKGYQHSKDEYNYDKSTDHFVTIVGRGSENSKRFFRFYEVGTSYPDKGQHDENKLFVNEDLSITGNPQHKTERTYTLTHVRSNKTNGNFK